MKKTQCVLIILILSTSCAFSQGAVSDQFGKLRDMYGAPVRTVNYSNTKGTPYFLDDWAMGMVKLQNGDTFNDVALKYDIVDDLLLFTNPFNGQAMGFKDPVQEFTLTGQLNKPNSDLLFRKGYNPTPDHFFQVLVDGRIQLVKRTSKIVKEAREFNSASITKAFYVVTDYYIVKTGGLIKIKKIKNDILSILDRKDELLNFAEKNKLTFKSEEDLSRLILYYNSL